MSTSSAILCCVRKMPSYFLRPSELFSEIAKRGTNGKEVASTFILDDLARILNNIEQSTMGTSSEDDFDNFEDLDKCFQRLFVVQSEFKFLIHGSNIVGSVTKTTGIM